MGITSIKDTVHRYIDLDDFEERVIGTPWFQRLRRVKQNDVSSAVYPTMQATRFEHSLGAMHLAGACIEAALGRDSEHEKKHIAKFLAVLRTEVSEAISGVTVSDSDAATFARKVARLYGLLHDVGHPPYSHLLESCWSAKEIGIEASVDAWHEHNGELVAGWLLPASLELTKGEEDLLSVVSHVASKKVRGLALIAIKRLVDAVIDVDRMDFVIRDGKTSGSEFGTYDLERLVQSFRVHVEAPEGDVPKKIYIRPSDKALSAVESLLQERYKIYRWVHFHHRVMQAKALMRFALRRSKDFFDEKRLQPEKYVSLKEPDAGYVLLGDAWVDRALDRKLATLLSADTALDDEQQKLLAALEALILRQSKGISLWKRVDGYSTGTKYFDSYLRSAFERMTDGPKIGTAVERFGSVANWVGATLAPQGGRPWLDAVCDIANAKSGEEWFLIESVKFAPAGEERLIVHTDGKQRVQHMTEVSSVAAGLEASRKRDVHLFAFRFPCPAKADEADVCARGREKVAEAFVEAFEKLPGFREALEGVLDPPAAPKPTAVKIEAKPR